MAKVLLFPQKLKLPKGLEDGLREVAKDYVGVLYSMAAVLGIDGSDEEKYEEFLELVGIAFAQGIYDAIEELEED